MKQCSTIMWNFLPSFAEADRVIESCLFWNIPTPHDRLVSKATLSPILKLGGSKVKTLCSLLDKISTKHVKTNCPTELRRCKSSISILPASRYPTQNNFLNTIEHFDRFLSKLIAKKLVSATSVRNHVPCLCWRVEISCSRRLYFTLHWDETVSDNHFRLCHVFRSHGDNSARIEFLPKEEK